MSLLKSAAIAASIALLTACGGGGSTPPPPPPATGQLMVWTSASAVPGGGINVSIDNTAAGTLTTYYAAPRKPAACGAAGTITKTVTAGSHTVSAASFTQPGVTWAATSYTVAPNGCFSVELF